MFLERPELGLALLPPGGDRDHRAAERRAFEGLAQVRGAKLGAERQQIFHPRSLADGTRRGYHRQFTPAQRRSRDDWYRVPAGYIDLCNVPIVVRAR
jgi:hypothetical protein